MFKVFSVKVLDEMVKISCFKSLDTARLPDYIFWASTVNLDENGYFPAKLLRRQVLHRHGTYLGDFTYIKE